MAIELIRGEGGGLCVHFSGRLDPISSIDTYLGFVDDPDRNKPIVYDFSGIKRAFPNTVLPILCDCLILRRNGYICKFVPPSDDSLRQIFERTGILHHFDPEKFGPPTSASDRHLAAIHVLDVGMQHSLVSELTDLLLRSTNLNMSVLNAFRWILNEVSGNIFDHSNSPIGGFVQLDIHRNNRLSLCICDPGDGIAKSIKSAGRHGHIRTATEAVEYAVRRGVTRDPDRNQGNGLAGSLSLAKAFKGRLAIRSDDGLFIFDSTKMLKPARKMRFPLYGTLVDIQLNMDISIEKLGEVITESPGTDYEPHDVLTDDYGDNSGDAMRLTMEKETFGFGSRDAGIQMRTKAGNILQNSGSLLIIDWSGVPLMSSSYADEFIGKLFSEIGPIDFSSRVKMVGMDKDTKHILDFAIKQRMAQRLGQRW